MTWLNDSGWSHLEDGHKPVAEELVRLLMNISLPTDLIVAAAEEAAFRRLELCNRTKLGQRRYMEEQDKLLKHKEK